MHAYAWHGMARAHGEERRGNSIPQSRQNGLPRTGKRAGGQDSPNIQFHRVNATHSHSHTHHTFFNITAPRPWTTLIVIVTIIINRSIEDQPCTYSTQLHWLQDAKQNLVRPICTNLLKCCFRHRFIFCKGAAEGSLHSGCWAPSLMEGELTRTLSDKGLYTEDPCNAHIHIQFHGWACIYTAFSSSSSFVIMFVFRAWKANKQTNITTVVFFAMTRL